MKKIFGLILVVLIVAFGVYFFSYKDGSVDAVRSDVYNLFLNVSGTRTPEYTKDLKINSLNGIIENDFYYNTLNDEQKKIYTAISYGVKDFKDRFNVQNYNFVSMEQTLDDVGKALSCFLDDHPEVFYVNNKYTVYTKDNLLFGTLVDVKINFTEKSLNDVETKISRIETEINNILNNIPSDEPIEKELYFHDIIGENVKYYEYDTIENIPDSCHSIEGVFLNKEAVCDGFSEALNILLSRVNIPSIAVIGELEEAHEWNLVKLDDGWYNLDLTSDKSIESTDKEIVTHVYFNRTTEDMQETHIFNDLNILPDATATKYMYYNYYDKNILSTDNTTTKLEEILDNNKNEYLVEFKVNGQSNITSVMSNVFGKSKYGKYTKDRIYTYYDILDAYIVMIK